MSSEINNSTTFFISGSGVPTSGSNDINLYIEGQAQFSASGSLPLSLDGCDGEFLSLYRMSLDKFNSLNDNSWWRLQQGYYSHHPCVGSGLYMFTQGFGDIDGAFPSSDHLNLVLKAPLGQSSGLNLFLLNNDNPSNSIDIYLPSVSGIPFDSIDLYIKSKDIKDSGTDPLWLFSRGWSG